MSGTQVFVTTYGGSVRALDLATGEENWIFETPSDVYATPTVANGNVYVGAADGKLYALDKTTGNKNWSYRTGFPVNAPVAVDEQSVYLTELTGPRSSFVTKLNKRGSQDWRHDMTVYSDYGNDVEAGPTLGPSRVFIGSGRSSSTFVALSKETGKKDWTYSSEDYGIESDAYYRTATAVNNTVYAPLGGPRTERGYLHAFDAKTGDLRWRYQTDKGTTIDKACAATSDSVFLLEQPPMSGQGTATLRKLNTKDGSTQWKTSLNTTDPRGTPSVTSKSVFVGSVRIDRKTGKKAGPVGGKASWSESCVTNGNLINHGGGGYQLWRVK